MCNIFEILLNKPKAVDVQLRPVHRLRFRWALLMVAGASHALLGQVRVANTFGPENQGYGYVDLGWTVSGPATPFNAGSYEEAFSFTPTSSGSLNEITVMIARLAQDKGPHDFVVRLAERNGSDAPSLSEIIESWEVSPATVGIYGVRSGPIRLSSRSRSFLTTKKSYWIWVTFGSPTTNGGWVLNPDPTVLAPHVLRRGGEPWLPVANETASVFAVTVGGETSRLTNLSIRTFAGSEAQTLIMGVVLAGGGSAAPLLARGVGPSLDQFGVAGTLRDPALAIFSGATPFSVCDNWAGDAQVIDLGLKVGAFLLASRDSRDAAIVFDPPPGNYTIHISGVGGTTGVTLAELYDSTPVSSFTVSGRRIVNLSARAQVGRGAEILIAGFNVAGLTRKTVLIRAIGPALAEFGVEGFLADPKLSLFSGSLSIQSNDNWPNAPEIVDATALVGAFPLANGSRDAVLLCVLLQQRHDFLLQPFDVVLDLVERARSFVFVEVAVERDSRGHLGAGTT